MAMELHLVLQSLLSKGGIEEVKGGGLKHIVVV